MTKSFKFYLIGQGISQFGDWLFIVALNWLIIDVMMLNSWHGNLQRLVAGLTVLLAGTAKVRFPSAWSPRAVVLGMVLFSAAKSGLFAGLCYENQMSFSVLLTFGVIGGFLTVASAPAHAYFQRSLVGEQQHLAVSLTDFLYWFARCGVGVVVSTALVTGTWALFAFDALSYLPLLFIVAMVRLPYRKPEEERAGSTATFGDGMRSIVSNPKVAFLLLVLWVQDATCAIVFSLVAEIIRRDLGGSGADYGRMLAITGAAGLLGSIITLAIVRCGHRIKLWAFLATTLLVPLPVMGIGLSGSIAGLWVCYGIFTCIICPRTTLAVAESNLVPLHQLGGVSRVKAIIGNAVMPGLWFVITASGWAAGLTPSRTIAITAGLGLGLTVLLVLWAARKGLLDRLFVPNSEA